MMLWKNLKAGTIVDACVGIGRKRAEKLEAAGADAKLPSADGRNDPQTTPTARETIQPAE